MFDYKLLAALAEVVQQGSFERAAQSLSITQSAVSQRIKLLEQRIGRPLLIRSTPVQPTAEGRKLIQHARQVQLMESDLLGEFTQLTSDIYQTLYIAVNADSLATWLPSAFSELFQHNILIKLLVDDQEITHEYLKNGMVEACISTCEKTHQGCKSELLGSMEYVAVASPVFFEKYGHLPFRQIPTIEYDQNDNLANAFLKKHFGLEPGQYPAHKLPSVQAFMDAALSGIAYAIVPELQATPYLNSGEMVEMVPGKRLSIPLYWHYLRLETSILKQTTKIIHKKAQIYLKPN